MNGFVAASKFIIKNIEANRCIDDINEKHCTETFAILNNNPEVFTLNLQWDGEPLPTDILQLMISLPQILETKKLYDKLEEGEARYALKGLVCF